MNANEWTLNAHNAKETKKTNDNDVGDDDEQG
jgi:hypothetical protein